MSLEWLSITCSSSFIRSRSLPFAFHHSLPLSYSRSPALSLALSRSLSRSHSLSHSRSLAPSFALSRSLVAALPYLPPSLARSRALSAYLLFRGISLWPLWHLPNSGSPPEKWSFLAHLQLQGEPEMTFSTGVSQSLANYHYCYA